MGIITELPLQCLPSPFADAIRADYISEEGIKKLLTPDGIDFILAEIGKPIVIIPKGECFDFWKKSVKGHLADTTNFYLEDYPDGYALVASRWESSFSQSLIVLEKHC